MEVDQEYGLNVCQRRPMELSPQKERPSKMPRADVVALAQQLSDADDFIQANICNKLKPIADQMKFLRQQAFQILESARRDRELHHTQCSFKKVPGQIYHLYEKDCGERYMSMLSPGEWAVTTGPAQTHLGSFRLEADQSWTPEQDVNARDKEMLAFRQFIQNGDGLPALMGSRPF
ncbi:uncharacterized protein C1orf50 homolog [Galendromus occidentalis]|uniref:Uncharacterized protein C1orf50 homolog n=1 Tax=Galendromus occidentalis TaxID=34638 RepID=A0AAJ6QQU9_9ACAR|nr:uncharacterized protein C1orf50 homolog [Galendromus occidentalis]